jgi:hypothetical protein
VTTALALAALGGRAGLSGAHVARASSSNAASSSSSSSAPRWTVLPVAGDGRCLFRSVAQARAVVATGAPLDAQAELAVADALRAASLDELQRRRDEYEWAVEGDFDAYVAALRAPHAWGGEMELLMASQVLRAPIAVAMLQANDDENNNGGAQQQQQQLRVIAAYGEEFGGQAATVLFHGAGHYEALWLRRDNEEEGSDAAAAVPHVRARL